MTILKIYKNIGQYKNICNVTFKEGSSSYQKFGSDILGEFFYTRSERKRLQEKLGLNDDKDCDGNIKFIAYSNEMPTEIKKELEIHGFYSRDVNRIIYDTEKKNQYLRREIRTLPEPIHIEYNSSDFDEIDTLLWLKNKRRELGLNLTHFEMEKERAYRIILNHFELPEGDIPNEYIDSITGQLKTAIRYFVLKYKFVNKLSSGKEYEEFLKMMDEKAKEDSIILTKELNRVTGKLKRIALECKKELNILINLVSSFEPERLSITQVPVWWNLERFLHIFMRHVTEVKIGEKITKSNVFQYNFNDIKRLLKIIIEKLSPEINQHFNKFPNKDFKRHGEMSVYYEGDYYAIHIRKDGLLMTFYKTDLTTLSY